VLVFNGDVLSGHDIGAQLALHAQHNAAVTLYLTEVADARAFGCVPVDSSGRVTAFLEKMDEPVTNLINAGCYIFRRDVIDTIPYGQVISVERQTFPQLLASGATVMGYVDSGYWLDLGTPAAFVQGSCDLVRGIAPSPAVPGPTGEALILAGADVDASAVVVGGSCIGAGVVVGPGAVIDGSVVFDDAVIAVGAQVRASVIGRGAVIGAGTVLDGVVVGDGADIGGGNELLTGVRVWPGVVLAPGSVRFSSDSS
jgi:mannose-1-phosphate guanylyltransferase